MVYRIGEAVSEQSRFFALLSTVRREMPTPISGSCGLPRWPPEWLNRSVNARGKLSLARRKNHRERRTCQQPITNVGIELLTSTFHKLVTHRLFAQCSPIRSV
jgi:hypothetical protein